MLLKAVSPHDQQGEGRAGPFTSDLCLLRPSPPTLLLIGNRALVCLSSVRSQKHISLLRKPLGVVIVFISAPLRVAFRGVFMGTCRDQSKFRARKGRRPTRGLQTAEIFCKRGTPLGSAPRGLLRRLGAGTGVLVCRPTVSLAPRSQTHVGLGRERLFPDRLRFSWVTPGISESCMF